MPEKELKFEPAEAAVERAEEREIEKSPEEMLKEALPLAWERALEFAEENGFDEPEGIKKRIDLAEKYNLELEHFFYDPEKIERGVPTKERIEKTAEESEYIRELAMEFSTQSKKPVFCIFNARSGTIYSCGMDTMNTRLNSQFKELARKEYKTVQELRDEFVRDLKNDENWKENKGLALMEVTKAWVNVKRLEYFVGQSINTKVASFFYGGDKMDNTARDVIKASHNLLFVDASGRKYPASFKEVSRKLWGLTFSNAKADDGKWDIEMYSRTLESDEGDMQSVKETISSLLQNQRGRSAILLNVPKGPMHESLWFDNFPHILGRIGKEFSHEILLFPTQKIVQSAQQVEYLSEKVKNALRYYQKDEEGRNWFERNFEGIMLGKENAPQKGTPEYLAMFRKWVPYETDENGKAILDDKGYPVPRKITPMTMAAEDELSRIEAAMEELER